MPDPSDAAVRALAHRILERSEFGAAPSESWVQAAVRRLLDWLSHIQVLHQSKPILFWAIIAALLIVAALLIANIVAAIAAALGAPEPEVRTPGTPRPARDLRGEAESLAAAGSYLEAAHRLMLACFATLGERGVIELRPDRSNRWIRAALRRSPLPEAMSVELDSLVEGTERRWFGRREQDPEIYRRWQSALARLSSEAG